MKGRGRRTFRVGIAVAVAVGGFALSAALSAATGVIVKSAHVAALGTVVVNASGLTLYHDSSEAKGTIKCTGACATLWPPLLIAAGAKPSAELGVKAALLGTIKRPGGKVQITYNGMPLYLYSGDTKAGEANGEGVGGVWFAVATSGSIVKASTGSSAPASNESSNSSSGSTSGSSSSSTGSTSSSSSTGSTSSSSSSTGTGSTGGVPGSNETSTDCAVNPGADGCM